MALFVSAREEVIGRRAIRWLLQSDCKERCAPTTKMAGGSHRPAPLPIAPSQPRCGAAQNQNLMVPSPLNSSVLRPRPSFLLE